MLLNASHFSKQDFVTRFGEEEWQALTQRGVSESGEKSSEREAVFTAARSDSLAEVNTRIGEQLTALENAPALLSMIIADLVRARLYADSPTPHVLKRQAEARKILEEIARGRRQLDSESLHNTVLGASPDPVFSQSTLANFGS
jgi:phage gp36-like protein